MRDATSTPSTAFVPLGGPSLTITAPASGTIQVAASVEIADDDGLVSLYEDGRPIAGQGDCAGLAAPGTLFTAYVTNPGGLSGPWGTPGTISSFGCATLGPPGPVTFQTRPGEHMYELFYASCGCTTDPTFSNRKLWVTPMP